MLKTIALSIAVVKGAMVYDALHGELVMQITVYLSCFNDACLMHAMRSR